MIKMILPEVPWFVAEWIEHCRECSWDVGSALYLPNMDTREYEFVLKVWMISGNKDVFARAWLDGFSVKPKEEQL